MFRLGFIPQRVQHLYGTKAEIDALTVGLRVGDLAYSTDEAVLYRWNGVALDAIMISNVQTILSDDLQFSNDTERLGFAITDYTLIKEVKLGCKLSAVRIKFDMKCDYPIYSSQCRIYKNGVAEGTEQSEDGSGEPAYVTKSEDFSSFAVNDLIQVYAKGSNLTVSTLVKNFRFYYDVELVAPYIHASTEGY